MSSNGTASTLVSSFIAPSSPAAQSAPSPSPPASSAPLQSVTPLAETTAAPAPSSPTPAPSSPAAQSNQPSSAEPASSQAPAPSSQAPAPSSNPPPAQSSAAPAPTTSAAPPPAQSSAAPPASSNPPPANNDTTKTLTASTAAPSVTQVQTSTITITPTPTVAGETPAVVVITSIITPTNNAQAQPTKSVSAPGSSASSTDPAGLQGARAQNPSGLSTGGKTAVAVVVPVVVVALLVLGAILFWRRRKQQKNNEDERRKEVEEYGYNPNHDPTLPAVGMQSEMAEDSSGYRGWGNTATSSGRKASTTLTSGMTYSDSNSNPGGYQSPHSPTNGAYSDATSNDPLVNGRRETLDADGIAALGAAPHAITNNQAGVARGPSNASSSYSAANHSDNSGEYPGMPMNTTPEYYEQGYASYQDGPYGGNTAYGAGQQPVIRDVSARRNTRIENPSVFPQGNSGVATNF